MGNHRYGHLPEDCETQRLARTIYKMFSDSSNTLRCDRLVPVLAEVQSDDAAALISECASVTSKGSVRSWKVAGTEMTKKLHEIRSYGQSVFRRLASLPEIPTPGAASTPGAETPISEASDSGVEDLAELVGALDGNKRGIVQYTLLVAALLPEHVYCDDLHIREAFQVFDTRGMGQIKPNDLRVAMQCPTGYPGRFSQMVQECDRNGDGALDLADFRAMVRGEIRSQTPAGRTPAAKPPTDKWPNGSRADASSTVKSCVVTI